MNAAGVLGPRTCITGRIVLKVESGHPQIYYTSAVQVLRDATVPLVRIETAQATARVGSFEGTRSQPMSRCGYSGGASSFWRTTETSCE